MRCDSWSLVVAGFTGHVHREKCLLGVERGQNATKYTSVKTDA